MRQTFCFLFVLFLCLAVFEKAHAQSVILNWNASSTPTVTGYNVYYGTSSGNYPYKLNVGDTTTCSLSNLTAGVTYYFAATAYDAYGDESAFSSEVNFIVTGDLTITQSTTPGSPVMLQFPVQSGHWYEVQATTDLQNWTTVFQSDVASASSWMQFTDPNAAFFNSRFYRLVTH
jgi:hypothetical protein